MADGVMAVGFELFEMARGASVNSGKIMGFIHYNNK